MQMTHKSHNKGNMTQQQQGLSGLMEISKKKKKKYLANGNACKAVAYWTDSDVCHVGLINITWKVKYPHFLGCAGVILEFKL